MFVDQEHPAEIATEEDGLTLDEFTSYFREILNQPAWRTQADKEMDYKDGNQLGADILQKMKDLGIPPAVEPLIGRAIETIMGAEAKRRTDWRVTPHDAEGQEVADAFDAELNKAEKLSRADRACSEAYESQVAVGIGWVEVSREQDPFKYPYRCRAIHRNEIFWEMRDAHDPFLDESRYLIRTKWMDKEIAKTMFPDHKELLENSMSNWQNFDVYSIDGGKSTGLVQAADVERGWSIEEQQWRDIEHKKIRLFECWYRRWKNVLVMKMPDGRVVEFNMDDPLHIQAITYGNIKPQYAMISKLYQSWWAGPHKLDDHPTPYSHNHFHYVPFWGHKEDRTGVPFGRIRGMMYMQDNINASISKIRWGLAATVTKRTKGAVIDDDEHFRQEVSRVDADIILDAEHMAKPGAMFEIDRNFELNEQQYKMLQDSREAIQKIGGITEEFQGISKPQQSGVAFQTGLEQTQQSLAKVDDNFAESRMHVGDLLLSMIVQDNIGKPKEVTVSGNFVSPDRTIRLNEPVAEDGIRYLNNDVERTVLKVQLQEVPSSPTHRTQQMIALSEAYKAAPPELQRIIMPYLMNLMDVPNKEDIIKAMREAEKQPSPDMMMIQDKMKQTEIKQMMIEAQVKQLESQALKTNLDAQYAAMQGAAQVVQLPGVAPIADKMMQIAGYVPTTPPGTDPGFSPETYQPPAQPVKAMESAPTSLPPPGPQPTEKPPMPMAKTGPNVGINTATPEDNIPHMAMGGIVNKPYAGAGLNGTAISQFVTGQDDPENLPI